jgi:hypothetical protein
MVLNARAEIGIIVTGEETRIKISTYIQLVIQASQIVEVVPPTPTVHLAINVMMGIHTLIAHVIHAQDS